MRERERERERTGNDGREFVNPTRSTRSNAYLRGGLLRILVGDLGKAEEGRGRSWNVDRLWIRVLSLSLSLLLAGGPLRVMAGSLVEFWRGLHLCSKQVQTVQLIRQVLLLCRAGVVRGVQLGTGNRHPDDG